MSLTSRISDFYDDRILPRVIEVSCSDRNTGKWRHQGLAGVRGEVLEVGFGSGTNLGHYTADVTGVLAVEPADLAWERSAGAREGFGRPVRRVGLDGAAIDLPDASVDTVVSTYTLCTIPDLTSALAEIRRVLRPGSAFHFVEHGLAPDPEVAARQRRIQPVYGKLAGGCHIDRDIPAMVAEAGFTMADLDSFWIPWPKVMRPFGWLSIATARPG